MLECVVFIQMAGTAAADELGDRQRFRGFFRTEVSTRNIGPALAEMARHFNWMKIAIITENEIPFTKVCDSTIVGIFH